MWRILKKLVHGLVRKKENKIWKIYSLFTVPFLCIFMMSILILALPLSNLRSERKVKNMIPIVIISGVLGLIGFNILGLYVVGLYPWLVILGGGNNCYGHFG